MMPPPSSTTSVGQPIASTSFTGLSQPLQEDTTDSAVLSAPTSHADESTSAVEVPLDVMHFIDPSLLSPSVSPNFGSSTGLPPSSTHPGLVDHSFFTAAVSQSIGSGSTLLPLPTHPSAVDSLLLPMSSVHPGRSTSAPFPQPPLLGSGSPSLSAPYANRTEPTVVEGTRLFHNNPSPWALRLDTTTHPAGSDVFSRPIDFDHYERVRRGMCFFVYLLYPARVYHLPARLRRQVPRRCPATRTVARILGSGDVCRRCWSL